MTGEIQRLLCYSSQKDAHSSFNPSGAISLPSSFPSHPASISTFLLSLYSSSLYFYPPSPSHYPPSDTDLFMPLHTTPVSFPHSSFNPLSFLSTLTLFSSSLRYSSLRFLHSSSSPQLSVTFPLSHPNTCHSVFVPSFILITSVSLIVHSFLLSRFHSFSAHPNILSLCPSSHPRHLSFFLSNLSLFELPYSFLFLYLTQASFPFCPPS